MKSRESKKWVGVLNKCKEMFKNSKSHVILWWHAIQVMGKKAVQLVLRCLAVFYKTLCWARYHFAVWQARHRSVFIPFIIIVLICTSFCLSTSLQSVLEQKGLSENFLANLRSLYIAIGSSLVAASVIVFSFVLFVMQINIERMPYSLFRKFSTDARIISPFSVSFLLAILIGCVSLIQDTSLVAISIIGSVWGIILIFVLFFYAYRRSLALINPLEQLSMVIKESKHEMQIWVRRAKRAEWLFEEAKSRTNVSNDATHTDHDFSRAAYFRNNPHWTKGTERAIRQAISFARRYAENGDHEVSGAALTAVVLINKNYVEAKGKTFFSSHGFFDNPLSTDGFINNTLELLRQTNRISIARGDEQQIEQTFNAIAMLVNLYSQIDYSDEHATKFHAGLAAGYLSEAVKSCVPHNLADVLMEGVRRMGESAQVLLRSGQPDSVATITDNIAQIACTGIVNEEYRPVTQCAIEQLARLTISLLQVPQHDIRFAAKRIKTNVANVAKLFLNVPDIPLMSLHGTCLAAYYSSTTRQSLETWLAELVDGVRERTAQDQTAQRVIRNIESWADELYEPQKELLLLAVAKRSQFTFDMVHWVTGISKILLAVSNAAACGDRVKMKLRRHAIWLAYTLDWIPDDRETVAFVEAYQLTEKLFELSMDAHHQNCPDISEKFLNLLMNWAFRAGKHQVGWAILERSFYGLATLALTIGGLPRAEKLKSEVAERLAKSDAPDVQIRERTAHDIREKAARLYYEEDGLSRIDYHMGRMEPTVMRSLLDELANLLFPDTSAGESPENGGRNAEGDESD